MTPMTMLSVARRHGRVARATQALRHDAQPPSLAEAAKGGWGEAENGGEDAGEVKRVGKTGLLGHLFDQRAGLLQAPGGMVHFEAEPIKSRMSMHRPVIAIAEPECRMIFCPPW